MNKYIEQNSKKFFKKHIPIIAEDFAKKNGYIPSETRLINECLKLFCKKLKNGELGFCNEEMENV